MMEEPDSIHNENSAKTDTSGLEEIIIKPLGKLDVPEESLNKDEQQKVVREPMPTEHIESTCPFVCGICSEKFDKVNNFYSHLQTHGVSVDESMKHSAQEINKPGNIQSQGDKNVFNCGICNQKFPSMSLLHDHMLGVENVFNYSYSNTDHTAKPDSRMVDATSDSDSETCDMEIKNSLSGEEVSNSQKEKSKSLSNANTQTKIYIKKEGPALKRDRSLRTRSGTKRKFDQLTNLEKNLAKTRSENNVIEIKIETDMSHVDEPAVHTQSRSSIRSSRRNASKHIDYKVLAGLGSPKHEPKEISSTLKNPGSKSSVGNDVGKGLKEIRNKPPMTDHDVMRLEYEGGNSEQSINRDNKKTKISVKVVPKKKIKTFVAENEIKIQEGKIKETGHDEDVDKTQAKNRTEALDQNGLTLDTPAVKADGTFVDADLGIVKEELDSYINASDNDSDDDFIENRGDDDDDDNDGDVNNVGDEDFYDDDDDDDYVDDDQADPDFQTEDNGDNFIATLNDTETPEDYLKKFVGKKKKFQRSRDGQGHLLKNCLYPCGVCGRYYNWKSLKKHMYAHVNTRLVECKECGKKYKSRRHLKDHIRSVHAMKKFACPKCSSILKGVQSFEKHVMAHILKKEISEAIDEVVRTEVSDEAYMKWKTEQELELDKKFPNRKKYQQKYKKKSFGQIDKYKNAIDIDALKDGPLHGELVVIEREAVGTVKNLNCKICEKSFSSHEGLLNHMLEHNEEQSYGCDICNGYFQTYEHLQNHMTSVHGSRDLQCDICGECVRNRYALWSHKGKHLMKKDEYYSEEIVEKLQNEIAERAKQGMVRRRGRPSSWTTNKVSCHICGFEVLSVRYKRHLETHTETKEWECDICHKFYKTRRYMLDHRKKTHFANLISCDICNQEFKSNAYLEIHKQTHGPRDKFCKLCDKSFTTLAYLKTHMVTHEDKKRFRCEKCHAGFSHKQRLSIHMVEVHGEGASRPCKYCGDLFASRQKARKHERVAHEGYVQPPRAGKKNYHVLQMGESENESLENKIVRLLPNVSGEGGFTRVIPGVVKVPSNKSKDTPNIVSKDKQVIRLENGEEYQVMIDKERPQNQALEFVELTEEEQNVFIQEADVAMAPTGVGGDDQGKNVEQILEIPENAEQCQILLYPDGSFQLLNVVDNSHSS